MPDALGADLRANESTASTPNMTPSSYRAHRRQLGLTQAQLAALLGVTRETVCRREKGTAEISNEAALALRRMLSLLPARLPADIARCVGIDCPVRKTCARHLAYRSDGPGVFSFIAPRATGTDCEHRIEV
jgi:DNA-binding XRE family transcriptional regulator